MRFAHPLLASAVYGSASPERRRQVHERLAAIVTDPEERARHLALSATEPDETIAAELEDAARGGARRGAQQAAAELYREARRLTPGHAQDALARRQLGEASARLAAGDIDTARSLAEPLVASPFARAEALSLLGDIYWVSGSFEAATERLEQALAANPGPALAARTHRRLVYFSVAHDPARAIERADAAIDALDPDREPGAAASVTFDRYWAGLLRGEPPRHELLERWRELEAKAGRGALGSAIPLIHFHSIDDFEAARARHAVEDEWYRTRGRRTGARSGRRIAPSPSSAQVSWDLAERLVAECLRGDTAVRASRSVDNGLPLPFDRRRRPRQDGPRADDPAAADRGGAANWTSLVGGALALRAGVRRVHRRRLCGRRPNADTHAQPPRRDWDASTCFPTAASPSTSSRSSPSARTNAHERCSSASSNADVSSTGCGSGRRCRGRAHWSSLAEGDADAALAALDELDLDEAVRLPFDLGWTLLVRGRLCRARPGSGALRPSRSQQALEIFERLGAPPGPNRREASSTASAYGARPRELTATELRVAELTAAGLTNREVASRAFMSPKTVEANLARVYRKLGIRSRAELGARMEDMRREATANKRRETPDFAADARRSVERMADRAVTETRTTFLVELYRPGLDVDALKEWAARVRDAAVAMAGEGKPVRYLRSAIVPADESLLCVLEAANEELVREAYARAGLPSNGFPP